MTTDLDLLGQYTRQASETAFAELVRRHVNLVYSAALRQVRSPQLAEEVAQSVFTDLARNAVRLKPGTILTAWLYQVTRRTAIDVVRKESRRQWREQIAVEMTNMNATSNDWIQIEPLLDEAMDALEETDRAAILLRYYENKNLREVGESLGTSDDAAQKRVSRAVERLRDFFSKRNVTIGASGLVVLISANAVQAAPVGLAVAISTAATLAGTTVAATAIATATKTIAMTTLQKTLVTATVAVLAGAGIYEARQASQLREQNQLLRQQQAPLTEQIQQLQDQRNDATNRLTGFSEENSLLKSNLAELVKLRGDVQRLRQQTNDLSRLKQENRDLRLEVATGSDPTNQISSDDRLTLLKTHANDAMTTLLAAVKDFAINNNGQYPTGYEQLTAAGELKSTNFLDNVGLNDFAFVQDGSVDPQGNKIVLSLRVSLHEPGTPATRILGAISPDGVLHTEIFNENSE